MRSSLITFLEETGKGINLYDGARFRGKSFRLRGNPYDGPVTSEKISMTAPVTEEQAGERVHRISFAMPSRFTLETLPEPLDKRITFTVVESRKTAATRFSGRVHEKLAAQKTEELSDWLVRNGIVPKSNFVVALYNPPFIPGIFRRNEIIVDI